MSPLVILISLAIALSTTITIAAHYPREPQAVLRPWLIYLFKPLTTILILVVALLPGTFLIDSYAGAIALGLLFSLAGDIFLMLPGNYFLYGLVSFLLAHLCYGFAFFPHTLGVEIFWSLLPLVFLGSVILSYLWSALSEGLRVPISFYMFVIMGMGTLAVYRAMVIPSLATLSAATGALLFLTSDTLLAINRFRKPFSHAHTAVLATYFAGQFLIALSIHFYTFT